MLEAILVQWTSCGGPGRRSALPDRETNGRRPTGSRRETFGLRRSRRDQGDWRIDGERGRPWRPGGPAANPRQRARPPDPGFQRYAPRRGAGDVAEAPRGHPSIHPRSTRMSRDVRLPRPCRGDVDSGTGIRWPRRLRRLATGSFPWSLRDPWSTTKGRSFVGPGRRTRRLAVGETADKAVRGTGAVAFPRLR